MTSKEIAAIVGSLNIAFKRREEVRFKVVCARKRVEKRQAELDEALRTQKEKESEKIAALTLAKEKELAADQVGVDLKRRREQLDSATSERAYSSLKLQIELDEKKGDRFADEALVAYASAEEIDTELTRVAQTVVERAKELESAKLEFEETRSKAKIRLEEIATLIVETVERFPHDFQTLYHSAAERYGDSSACAPLVDEEYCGACNTGLPFDLSSNVQMGVATRCSNCSRLLYDPN